MAMESSQLKAPYEKVNVSGTRERAMSQQIFGQNLSKNPQKVGWIHTKKLRSSISFRENSSLQDWGTVGVQLLKDQESSRPPQSLHKMQRQKHNNAVATGTLHGR